jgi:hypothetical protein
VIAATQDDLLQGLLTGGAFLLIVLVIWILIHHSKPGMRIDIGIRGWVSLKPGDSKADAEEDQQGEGDGTDGDDGGDPRPPPTSAVGP